MMWLNRTFALLFILICQQSLAFDLRSEISEQKNRLGVLFETSSFKLTEGEIKGAGGRIEFSHAFNSKLSMDLGLATALNNENSVQSTFTGFSGYGFYSLFTDCCGKQRNMTLNGHSILTESDNQPQVFQVGIGLEQFFLNGSRGVYSFSGPGIAANYQITLWSVCFKASARYTEMETQQTKVKATLFGLGVMFPL